MFTINYRDHRGNETIIGDVTQTSFHEGALTATLENGHTWTFGPNLHKSASPGERIPVAYVMNANGATVRKYEFEPIAFSEAVQAHIEQPNELVA